MGNSLSTANGGWRLIYASYFSGMLTKNTANLSLALGAVPSGALTSAAYANVLSAGSLAYTLGKLFGGSFADWCGGKNTMVLSHLIMGLSYIGMSTGKPSPKKLTVLWFMSRLVHAALWPSCSILHKQLFMGHERFKSFAALLSTSSRLGAFAGSTVGGFLLARLGVWNRVIGLAGMYYVGIGVLIATTLKPENGYKKMAGQAKDTPQPETQETLETPEEVKEQEEYTIELRPDGWRRALSDPKLWLVLIGNSLTTPTFELVSLLPQYLSDTVPSLTTSQVGSLGSLFPLMAVPAVLTGAWLEPQLTPTTRMLYYVGGELLTLLSLRGLAGKPGTLSPTKVGALLMMTMYGFAPVMYIPPGAFIAKFAGPYTGSFSGCMDMGGNLLMVLFYRWIPRLKERGGWPLVLKVYSGTILLSLCSFAGYFYLERQDPLLESPFERRVNVKVEKKKRKKQ
jgi:sugar phosphate permease